MGRPPVKLEPLRPETVENFSLELILEIRKVIRAPAKI